VTTEDLFDLDYDDPEENEWVLPDLPSPDSVPDNTSCFGPLYFWRGDANPAQRKVAVAVTREITPPWRRGLGVTIRSSEGLARAFGLWWRGKPPRILSEAPEEKNLQAVVKRSCELSELQEN
jgi:hypothetical protein